MASTAALPEKNSYSEEVSPKFNFNITKALCSIAYVLKTINERADFHKLFKIIYFADKKHLVDYGVPITGDLFIAMENGPVPSNIYDFFKSIRQASALEKNIFNEFFSVEGRFHISLKTTPDFSYLSKSDIECLDFSITENNELNFKTLTTKSHDGAYKMADLNNEISFIEMAKDGGADEKTINYIKSIAENQFIRV